MKPNRPIVLIAGGLLILVVFAGCAWATGDEVPLEGRITHRMMMLVLQLGVILFAAKVGGIIFERLKLPAVLGELAAGMVVGPYAFGGLGFLGFANGLFPHAGDFAISPELYGIHSIAAIVLLFVTGLETDLRMLLRFSLAGSMVGVGGVVVSFILGDVTAMLFSEAVFGVRLGFLASPCLFLGIISTATSVGITARILSEKRKLDSPEGVTILAGAVIDDVLGIVLLTVVLGVLSAIKATGAVHWGHISVIASKAIAIWLVATAVGLVASQKIGFLLKLFRDPLSIAIMAFGIALILAGLFEEAGLAMIIGAYIAGLSLSRTDISNLIRERLAPIYAFLVPVFFCVMGMLVDFKEMGTGWALVFGVVYSAVAILAKLIGSGGPALAFGFNLRGALRVGVGMMPRGEVALVVAGIGLAAGFFQQTVFGVAIIMTLITTVIAPLVLVRLFEKPASGLRRTVGGPEPKVLSFSFGSAEIASFLLTKLRAIFAGEGFYIHRLEHEQGIYQLRKETIIMSIQQQGGDVIFECDEDDAPFINTAVYEVIGQLEQTVRGLQEPIDKEAIVRRVQEGGNGRKFDIGAYLHLEALVPRLRADDKRGIIDDLLESLVRQGLVRDAQAARNAVLAREEALSTGIQDGIAIPHGKTDAVGRLVCAVGLKPEGIDFGAFDGRPSTIFVLTLSPESRPAPHVEFMSAVSRLLTAEVRERLLAATTPEQMYEALTGRAAGRTAEAPPRGRVREPRRKARFSLEKYIRPELVTLDMGADTKEEVINDLLALLQRNGLVQNVDAARDAVLARERSMSTGIGDGIAIPHARTDAVRELVCAIGIAHGGVDFEALDGAPTQIFILTLSPKSTGAPHIQFMSSISRILSHDMRTRLLRAQTEKELCALILAKAAAVGDE